MNRNVPVSYLGKRRNPAHQVKVTTNQVEFDSAYSESKNTKEKRGEIISTSVKILFYVAVGATFAKVEKQVKPNRLKTGKTLKEAKTDTIPRN